MIDRTAFFAGVRARFGALKQPQVDGFNAILDEWECRPLADLRWLAYMLATAWHETAHTMQPIREIGRGAKHAYGRVDPETKQAYYGRGYVQLTWRDNYDRLGKLLSCDLVRNPDLALGDRIAAQIMFEGMIRGLFTGKKLGDYFGGANASWVSARRIINGTDRAEMIAGYARLFHQALTAADKPAPKIDLPKPTPDPAVVAALPAPVPSLWARILSKLGA